MYAPRELLLFQAGDKYQEHTETSSQTGQLYSVTRNEQKWN